MTKASEKSTIKEMPIIYATYYPMLRDVAMEHGYALALHGSLQRDFDIIAVPWVEEACDPKELADALSSIMGSMTLAGWEEKPHGRLCFGIMTGGDGYIDLSIMPRKIVDKELE